MRVWLAGLAGRLDGLYPSLERSPRRRVVLLVLSIVGPISVVFVVLTVWRWIYGLP